MMTRLCYMNMTWKFILSYVLCYVFMWSCTLLMALMLGTFKVDTKLVKNVLVTCNLLLLQVVPYV